MKSNYKFTVTQELHFSEIDLLAQINIHTFYLMFTSTITSAIKTIHP